MRLSSPVCLTVLGLTLLASTSNSAPAIGKSESVSARDMEVMDCVLADISAVNAKESPKSDLFWNRKIVEVSRQTRGPEWSGNEVTLGEAGHGLSRSIAEALVNDMIRRNQTRVDLSGYIPRCRSFALASPSKEKPDGLQALFKRPIALRLPGYARHYTYAVLRVDAPWRLHSMEATYVLHHSHNKWTVTSRDYVYFP